MKGWQDTAPSKAILWFERAQFIAEHPGWTYHDYDEAEASDILLDKEYRSMMSGLLHAKGKR